jgi:hypothetical protein
MLKWVTKAVTPARSVAQGGCANQHTQAMATDGTIAEFNPLFGAGLGGGGAPQLAVLQTK